MPACWASTNRSSTAACAPLTMLLAMMAEELATSMGSVPMAIGVQTDMATLALARPMAAN